MLRLTWEELRFPQQWAAHVDPFRLLAYASTSADGVFLWEVTDYQTERSGHEYGLEAAQLAAESAALSWLTEGVTALGGRVLDASEVALCVEALNMASDVYDEDDRGDRMQTLARKLGGG